jgi:manganese/iron transport system substrate-binding protein
MFRPAAVVAALLAVLLLAACSGGSSHEGSPAPALKAVTTITVLQDMVRQVGGDRVDVSSLLPAGADPHTYEPTPGRIRDVVQADIIFANGLDLEPGVLKVIEPNLPGGTPLVKLADEAVAAGFAVKKSDGGDNPHLWLSVNAARLYIRAIRDALAEADPEGAATYNANYESYLTRLDELDRYVSQKLAAVPTERRKLVSTHDAFVYMAQYMGLDVAGVVAESPGQEPSASDVADLIQATEDQGIPAVFEEPQLGGEADVLRQTAADAGLQICTLYSDALDDSVPTYIDLIRHNADEIARCLGG